MCECSQRGLLGLSDERFVVSRLCRQLTHCVVRLSAACMFRCNPQAGAEVTAGSTNIRDVCAEGSVRATCCLNATCGRAE